MLPSCFDRLSMRAFFVRGISDFLQPARKCRLTLSLSKGEAIAQR